MSWTRRKRVGHLLPDISLGQGQEGEPAPGQVRGGGQDQGGQVLVPGDGPDLLREDHPREGQGLDLGITGPALKAENVVPDLGMLI